MISSFCSRSALGTSANTNTKLLIYDLFQKGRVLAQDGLRGRLNVGATEPVVKFGCEFCAYPKLRFLSSWD